MRIQEMTATFGKLENETLILQPGLNIIEAPNEWGKSTWCAFLLAMLYGMDTRAKTTRTVIADKEHYAPWSGRPMSGRIRLTWQGRDITIERSTQGRVPLGEFKAYETDTGLPVRELTAENCGEVLLGAEQSVVRRSGFIRLSDLPVTRDDALRRRLNALVTTGDESGDGEDLAEKLKNLKNKCRYHKTGLIPQAEDQLSQVNGDIKELQNLQQQSETLTKRLKDQEEEQKQLENHLVHLDNQAAHADAGRVQAAEKNCEQLEQKLQTLETACEKLPSQVDLQKRLQNLQKFSEEMDRLLKEQQTSGKGEFPPAAPGPFSGMAPKEAVEMAIADQDRYEQLQLNFMVVFLLGAVCCAAAAVLFFALGKIGLGVIAAALAVGLLAWGFLYKSINEEKLQALKEKYGEEDPEKWVLSAQYYQKNAESYERSAGTGKADRRVFSEQLAQMQQRQKALCGENTVVEAIGKLQKLLSYREQLQKTRKEAADARENLEALKTMAKKPEKPEQEDSLSLSREETLQKIGDNQLQHQNLLQQIGQYQGRMESLGTEAQLQEKKAALEQRHSGLQTYYEALTIALASLEEATAELQRRFAPRITRRAQELMWQMTGGRYEKLTMDEDFSLKTTAEEEHVLHGALWRSEGTVDQLYLSLRLAVSEALIPKAPLILDDALVRFDSRRLEKALEILNEADRQVILFTCQDREGKLFPQAVSRYV